MTIKDSDNEIFQITPSRKTDNGYLICKSCHGYYQLKYGESLDDFESCECGSPLEYHKILPKISDNFDSSVDDSYNTDDFYEDYAELDQLLNILKKKSKNRKKVLINLYKRINIQEELLNEIKEERWTLWDILDQRSLQSDIKNEKKLIEDINEQEDRLLMIIKEQRQRAQSNDGLLKSFIKRIDVTSLLILAFVVVFMAIFLFLI